MSRSTPVIHLRPLDPASLLDAGRRERDLGALRADPRVDLVVVGGGVTGTGVALDAAARGLRVVLLEADDLANGTSRWSSKLVHGGLRYLAKGDVTVAWESAAERAVLAARVAPHLIRPLPQVVASFDDDRRSAALALAGFVMGDALKVATGTPRGMLPSPRMVGPELTAQLVPGVRRHGLRGAAVGWDCQLVDDARLVIAIARTAASYGARVLTRVRVAQTDSASGVVQAVDTLTGDPVTIQATWIVNATGVWASDLDPSISLRPSLGTHVVIPTALVGAGNGSLTVPVPGTIGRFVFALPQPGGISYVGITDNETVGASYSQPSPPIDDVSWILDTLSAALDQPVGPADAIGAFAGVRPLVESAHAGGSADISRRHLVQRTDRLITVTGGKLTTYRRMAADVVDLISDHPCPTRDLALVGAGPLPNRADVPDVLFRRYGTEAPEVWDLGELRPHLREQIGPAVYGVELEFGRAAELALTAQDLVERRTRWSLTTDSDQAQRQASDLLGVGLVSTPVGA